MATWADVRRLALALPETEERPSDDDTTTQWLVRRRPFVWGRPLRKGDHVALGTAAPRGPVLAAQVPDEGVKEALVSDEPDVYLTTPHFNGWPVVLVRLDAITAPDLEELVVEAWLARAPKRLVTAYLAQTDGR